MSGGSASVDFSASTTERPHEGAADYLHLTGSTSLHLFGRPVTRVHVACRLQGIFN